MRFAVSIPNFAEPAELVDLGVVAEASGWDGVFYWDHLYASPAAPMPIADPWVVLGALAARTSASATHWRSSPPSATTRLGRCSGTGSTRRSTW